MPRRLYKWRVNLLLNAGPRSETVTSGVPCVFQMFVKNNSAISFALEDSVQGMKCRIFEKESMMTRMLSCPLHFGNLFARQLQLPLIEIGLYASLVQDHPYRKLPPITYR